MKYVSIDIETTGLVEGVQVLEVGAVIEDTKNLRPITELPSFRAVLVHEDPYYRVNAWCIEQHLALFKEIETIRKNFEAAPNRLYFEILESPSNLTRLVYTRPDALEIVLNKWLKDYGGLSDKGKVVAAGKNFYAFDHKHLVPLLPNIKFHHRAIDPAAFFMEAGDTVPPETPVCCKRAGIEHVGFHSALDDAATVIKLVRIGMARMQCIGTD